MFNSEFKNAKSCQTLCKNGYFTHRKGLTNVPSSNPGYNLVVTIEGCGGSTLHNCQQQLSFDFQ